jgi:hypothetical protein
LQSISKEAPVLKSPTLRNLRRMAAAMVLALGRQLGKTRS